MKAFAFFLFFVILIHPIWTRADETLPFFEEVLQTSHNLIPREGNSRISSSQVCSICHTFEEVKSYLEPSFSKTSTESASAENAQSRPEETNPKALWNPADHRSNYKFPHPKLNENLSQSCLFCHDGAIGKDIHGSGLSREGSLPQLFSGKFLDHPVNIPYPRQSNGHFVPEFPLPNEFRYWSVPNHTDSGITLPTGPVSSYLQLQTHPSLLVRTSNGQVNCGSCHNPHTSEISAYLRENPKTLCLICHDR